MGEATSNILERKAATGRESHQARAVTVPKALRLTIAKLAEEMLDLPMASLSISRDIVENEGLEEALPAENLLLLMDGRGGRVGIVMLDAALVGGLVQQQTMGTVLPDFDEGRRMTQTDAALVAPMVEELLRRVSNVIEQRTDAVIFEDYRFSAMAEDQRLALMALEKPEYSRFSLTLDVARGARQGQLVFILPESDPEDPIALEAPGEDPVSEEKQPDMVTTALGLEAELDMVLCKLRLPLGHIEKLRPGDMIEMPQNVFPKVKAVTIEGTAVGQGIIGQIDGQRAVQLMHKPKQQNTPQRRESDRNDLELPEVTPLGGEAPMARPEPADMMLPALPDMSEAPALPDLPGDDLPDLPDLPALDDLPPVEEPPAPDLPDLDGLPELDDLPDLADLPDLKMA